MKLDTSGNKKTTDWALKRKSLLLSLWLSIIISGCRVGPDYVKPEIKTPLNWIEQDDPVFKNDAADSKQWWKIFDDPVLEKLILKAYEQNLSLHAAGIRVLEARAQLGITTGNLYPQSQAFNSSYGYNTISKNKANTIPDADFSYSSVDLGFDVAWELDFWGKFNRAIESDSSRLEASIAEYDNIMVSLTAEVARTYVLLRTYETRLVIAAQNVSIQQKSLNITEIRFKEGDVTELDVQQARALLNDTQATIPQLQDLLRQAQNALAILLGVFPGELGSMIEEPLPIPELHSEITIGLPAELLRRRPDIRLAERQLAAQSALIGVAKADLYPHFSLFGNIALTSSDAGVTAAGYPGGSSFGDLWNSDSIQFFSGPGVSWDILNYGRIKNQVRVQDARFQQLVVLYQEAVLDAVREVENATSAFSHSKEEMQFLSNSVKAAKRSVELAMIQYREGLVDYQRVLDTLRFQSQQQDRETEIKGSVVLNTISIYKALGGGWQLREGHDFVPDNIKQQMRERTNWGNLLEPTLLDSGAFEPTP
jgi:NodT family efflux transporter outer membrane factor (OMF) lipoprotein